MGGTGQTSTATFVMSNTEEWTAATVVISANPSPNNAKINKIYLSSATLGWDVNTDVSKYILQASTDSGFDPVQSSSSTANVYLSTLTVSSLLPNVTYYFRVGSFIDPTTCWTPVSLSSPTHALEPGSPVSVATFTNININNFTVNWASGTESGGYNPAGTLYYAERSLYPFPNSDSGNVEVSTTGLSCTFTQLFQGTEYYVRVKSVNHSGVATAYHQLGSVKTQKKPVPDGTIVETGRNYANGTGANPNITHGLTINKDDFIVICIHVDLDDEDINDNNGDYATTTIFEEPHPQSGQDSTYAIFYRIAGFDEPDNYTYTWGGVSDDWTITIQVFSGVAITDPWDVAPSIETRNYGDSTTLTAQSVITSTGGTMGNLIAFTNSACTFSNQTNGYGPIMQIGLDPNIGVSTRTFSSAGATGISNMTLSAEDDWIIYQTVLKPSLPVPPEGADILNVYITSCTVCWDKNIEVYKYILQASTSPDFVPVVDSISTSDVDESTLTVTGLSLNTTYYFRAGNLYDDTTCWITSPVSTCTLAAEPALPVGIPVFSDVFAGGFSVSWSSGTDSVGYNAPGTTYDLESSTSQNFDCPGDIEGSTAPAGNLSYTFSGLPANTTCYVQIRAVNRNSVETDWVYFTSTVTLAAVPSVSGSVSTGTWTNNSGFVFSNAAGWGTGGVSYYRYVWNQDPIYAAWNDNEAKWETGNSTRTADSDGLWYMHLKSYNTAGEGNPSTTDYGPYNYDSSSAVFSNFYSQKTDTSWIDTGEWNDNATPAVKVNMQDTGSGLRIGSQESQPDSSTVLLLHMSEPGLSAGETTYDSSMYGNNGVIIGATAITTDTWKTGGETEEILYFDGDTYHILIQNNESLNISGEFTIEAWAKVKEFNTDGSYRKDLIASMADYDNKEGFYFGAGESASPGVTDKKPFVYLTNGADWFWTGANNPIKENKWYHIVGTRKGNIVKLYINGKLDKSTDFSGDLNPHAGSLYIGSQSSGFGDFNGLLDEVRILNRALSDEEVACRYNSGCIQYSTSGVDGTWNIEPSTAVTVTSGDNGTILLEVSTTSALPFHSSESDCHVKFLISDIAGNIAESNEYAVKIDTVLPAVPVLSSPGNDTWVSSTTAAYVWQSAADTLSGLSNFVLQVSTAINFDGVIKSSSPVGTDASITDLVEGTTYYWRVRGLDWAGNYGLWCDTWTVKIDTTAPAGGMGMSFSNITVSSMTVQAAVLTDNVSGSVKYELDCTNDDAYDRTYEASNSTDTASMVSNSTYTYRYRAKDAAGNETAWSGYYSTCTLSVPPGWATISCDLSTGTWYNASTFTFTAIGGFSTGTVAYYEYSWDTNTVAAGYPNTWQDDGDDDLEQYTTFTSSSWYLHVKGCSWSGTENGTFDYGPFYYSTAVPMITIDWPVSDIWYANVISSYSGTVADNSGAGIDTTTFMYSYAEGAWTSFSTDTFAGGYDWCDIDEIPDIPETPGITLQVKVRDKIGNEGFSAVYSIKVDTTPPAAPILITPAADTWSSSTTVSFVWNASMEATSGITNYVLEVSTDINFGGMIKSSSPVGTNASIKDLAEDNTYYWRVRAEDAAGNYGSWCDTWTVKIDTTPPSGAMNISFSNVGESSMTVQAAALSDGISGSVEYEIDCTNNDAYDRAYGAPDSVSAVSMTANSTYTYRYRAHDAAGNETDWSGDYSTCTLSVPPGWATTGCDMSTGTWYNTTTFTFTAIGGFSTGTVAYYEYSWDTHTTAAQYTDGTWGNGSLERYAVS
ncbi:MAG: hypothetical protein JXJ19_08150, partial [Elusimicrobia bacterium]|nr:hypothetical protein [Elusimicrobiota bacterium]